MKLSSVPVLAIAVFVASSPAHAAELKVLSGNGPKAAVRELCSQFEKSTGNKIDLRFGVNPEVKQQDRSRRELRCRGRQSADRRRLDQGRHGRRSARRYRPLRLGVAVQSGAPKPDISSVEAFKRALLGVECGRFSGQGRQRTFISSVCSTAWASRPRCKASSSRWRPRIPSRWWRAARPTWSWWWPPASPAFPASIVVGPDSRRAANQDRFCRGLEHGGQAARARPRR